jgi:hypothetical protein
MEYPEFMNADFLFEEMIRSHKIAFPRSVVKEVFDKNNGDYIDALLELLNRKDYVIVNVIYK